MKNRGTRGTARSEEHRGQMSDSLDETTQSRWTDQEEQPDRKEEEISSRADGLSVKQTARGTGVRTKQTAGRETSRRWTNQMGAQANV